MSEVQALAWLQQKIAVAPDSYEAACAREIFAALAPELEALVERVREAAIREHEAAYFYQQADYQTNVAAAARRAAFGEEGAR